MSFLGGGGNNRRSGVRGERAGRGGRGGAVKAELIGTLTQSEMEQFYSEGGGSYDQNDEQEGEQQQTKDGEKNNNNNKRKSGSGGGGPSAASIAAERRRDTLGGDFEVVLEESSHATNSSSLLLFDHEASLCPRVKPHSSQVLRQVQSVSETVLSEEMHLKCELSTQSKYHPNHDASAAAVALQKKQLKLQQQQQKQQQATTFNFGKSGIQTQMVGSNINNDDDDDDDDKEDEEGEGEEGEATKNKKKSGAKKHPVEFSTRFVMAVGTADQLAGQFGTHHTQFGSGGWSTNNQQHQYASVNITDLNSQNAFVNTQHHSSIHRRMIGHCENPNFDRTLPLHEQIPEVEPYQRISTITLNSTGESFSSCAFVSNPDQPRALIGTALPSTKTNAAGFGPPSFSFGTSASNNQIPATIIVLKLDKSLLTWVEERKITHEYYNSGVVALCPHPLNSNLFACAFKGKPLPAPSSKKNNPFISSSSSSSSSCSSSSSSSHKKSFGFGGNNNQNNSKNKKSSSFGSKSSTFSFGPTVTSHTPPQPGFGSGSSSSSSSSSSSAHHQTFSSDTFGSSNNVTFYGKGQKKFAGGGGGGGGSTTNASSSSASSSKFAFGVHHSDPNKKHQEGEDEEGQTTTNNNHQQEGGEYNNNDDDNNDTTPKKKEQQNCVKIYSIEQDFLESLEYTTSPSDSHVVTHIAFLPHGRTIVTATKFEALTGQDKFFGGANFGQQSFQQQQLLQQQQQLQQLPGAATPVKIFLTNLRDASQEKELSIGTPNHYLSSVSSICCTNECVIVGCGNSAAAATPQQGYGVHFVLFLFEISSGLCTQYLYGNSISMHEVISASDHPLAFASSVSSLALAPDHETVAVAASSGITFLRLEKFGKQKLTPEQQRQRKQQESVLQQQANYQLQLQLQQQQQQQGGGLFGFGGQAGGGQQSPAPPVVPEYSLSYVSEPVYSMRNEKNTDAEFILKIKQRIATQQAAGMHGAAVAGFGANVLEDGVDEALFKGIRSVFFAGTDDVFVSHNTGADHVRGSELLHVLSNPAADQKWRARGRPILRISEFGGTAMKKCFHDTFATKKLVSLFLHYRHIQGAVVATQQVNNVGLAVEFDEDGSGVTLTTENFKRINAPNANAGGGGGGGGGGGWGFQPEPGMGHALPGGNLRDAKSQRELQAYVTGRSKQVPSGYERQLQRVRVPFVVSSAVKLRLSSAAFQVQRRLRLAAQNRAQGLENDLVNLQAQIQALTHQLQEYKIQALEARLAGGGSSSSSSHSSSPSSMMMMTSPINNNYNSSSNNETNKKVDSLTNKYEELQKQMKEMQNALKEKGILS